VKIYISLSVFILFLCSCSGSGEENRYSIGNILSASATVVREKGIGNLSAEEINREIERSYSSAEDALQKKSTIRQHDSGENDYRYIFDDMIKEEKYQSAKEKRDPFRNTRRER
jgi:hypothetical protein